jgi:topoisomerase IA-like protein
VPPVEFNASVSEAELDTPPIDDSVAFVGQQTIELIESIASAEPVPIPERRESPRKRQVKKKTPAKKAKAKPHARKK